MSNKEQLSTITIQLSASMVVVPEKYLKNATGLGKEEILAIKGVQPTHPWPKIQEKIARAINCPKGRIQEVRCS